MFITEIRKLRWTLDVAAPPRPDRGLQLLPRGLRTPRRGRGISFKYHFASFWWQEEPRVPFFSPESCGGLEGGRGRWRWRLEVPKRVKRKDEKQNKTNKTKGEEVSTQRPSLV